MSKKPHKQDNSNFFNSIIQWYKKRREKKRREREARKKNIIREYTEAILVALVAAMILRILLVQAFRIPTGSMKDTLLVGDFLLVNKFIYGVRTPDRIPLVNINIPYIRLPAFKEPKPGEIIVFKYPLDPKLDYIKRCIAIEGQTVEVREGHVFVDGKPEGKSEFIKRVYDPNEGVYVLHYKITKENGKTYTVRYYENTNYVSNTFGPITGSTGRTVEMREGELLINGRPGGTALLLEKTYQEDKDAYLLRYRITDKSGRTFEISRFEKPQRVPENYGPLKVPDGHLFAMGDNRNNSADSRSWGFLPRENIVGQALIIYWSWDKHTPLYKIGKKIRWARIGDLIR